MRPPRLGSFISIPLHKEDPFFHEKWLLGTDTRLSQNHLNLKGLLVVGGAAFPLAVAIRAAGAQGAGEEVGGARGHEVTDCGRNVHSLVGHRRSGPSTRRHKGASVSTCSSNVAAGQGGLVEGRTLVYGTNTALAQPAGAGTWQKGESIVQTSGVIVEN